MKKILLSLFTFLFIPGIINAASANVQVSAPSSVYVGDTVKVSVTVSSGSSLGNWNYIISYDDSILEYVNELNEVDTTGVTPMAHSIKISNVMREDVVKQDFTREEMLKNALEEEDGFFRVPRIN